MQQTIAIRRALPRSTETTRPSVMPKLLAFVVKIADGLAPRRSTADLPPPEWFRYPPF